MSAEQQKGMVKYQASDGSEVTLTPGIVAKYIVTKGQQADDREIYSFMARCQARHLNPLAGDAYMVVYKGQASVIVSKDYFVRTATQQPTFNGMKAGVVVINRQGELVYREGSIVGGKTEKLVGGWAEVYDKSRQVPSRAEVSLEEYDQGRNLWLSKPATMIRKVALVQALREAYPGAFGGLYDADEMPEEKIAVDTPAPAPAEQTYEEQVYEAEQEEHAAEAEIQETEEADVYDAELYDEEVSF